MSRRSREEKLSRCGCCGDEPAVDMRTNRPGLSELTYRAGVHATFLRRMLAALPPIEIEGERSSDGPSRGSLDQLTTRATEDASIALLDAWAAAAHVLAFYQERIINEGYLRTATERLSVLELARAIGYELAPGVAAGTALAFTMETAEGAPVRARIPLGTKVQSIPGQDELPQTFETSLEIEARPGWNALSPRAKQRQKLKIVSGDLRVSAADNPSNSVPALELWLAGVGLGLNPGDRMVVVLGNAVLGNIQDKRLVVLSVHEEAEKGRTRVVFSAGGQSLPFVPNVAFDDGVVTEEPFEFDRDTVETEILEKRWSESDLQVFIEYNGWDADQLLETVEEIVAEKEDEEDDRGLFVFRERLGFFGHNATAWLALSENLRFPNDDLSPPDAAYPKDWDTETPLIWTDSRGVSYTSSSGGTADVYLERGLEELREGGWAMFEGPTARLYLVAGIADDTLADFAMTLKATGLRLQLADGSALPEVGGRRSYPRRKTTAYVESEKLELAELEIEDAVAADSSELMLDGMVLGLEPEQTVLIQGEREDAPGVTEVEKLTLENIHHAAGYTTLSFTGSLTYGYKRDTVKIYANVVAATHGESVAEILGSGHGGEANQSFDLKQGPLTHVSAATTSGAESTLAVRVNGVEWSEESSLFASSPGDEIFQTRLADDGTVTVRFGDGVSGARLPTGGDNVEATYRKGIGLEGEVEAGQLSLLTTRPLGVKEVTNPMPAAGAADPEERDDARDNAPLTVVTLDRIVSLTDYTDFVRAFAGVGKAQAVALWDGERRLVQVTAATAAGDPISEAPALLETLQAGIEGARSPNVAFRIGGFRPAFFNVTAYVEVDASYQVDDVLEEIRDALESAFSFAARDFAQPVTAAEVIATIQGIAGVVYVDLEKLHRMDGSAGAEPEDFLPAAVAQWDQNRETVDAAELLLLNPIGLEITEFPAS